MKKLTFCIIVLHVREECETSIQFRTNDFNEDHLTDRSWSYSLPSNLTALSLTVPLCYLKKKKKKSACTRKKDKEVAFLQKVTSTLCDLVIQLGTVI